MNHTDHVTLLQPGISPARDGATWATWADVGAGDGAFTLALAALLGPGAIIFTIDQDRRALERGAAEAARRFPAVVVRPIEADFTGPLDLPLLDGLVMANSLHFVRDKEPLVRQLRTHLKPEGRFLLVEYNVDRGNHWVPHPLSYPTWAALAERTGFGRIELIGRVPSRFLGEIYSATAINES